jgi:hypothetical protein
MLYRGQLLLIYLKKNIQDWKKENQCEKGGETRWLLSKISVFIVF